MTISETIKTRRNDVPNQAYDMEYATQFRKEVDFLKEHGIDYTYKKKVGEYRIPTYKYTKTPELFRLVAEFYEQHRLNKEFNSYAALVKAAASTQVLQPQP